jgi:iron complex outermembrane recepter protein
MPSRIPPVNVRPLARVIALLAGGAMASHSVAAGLEEVVVTAEKREESLQDTPISLVALSGASLEQQGVTNLNELPRNVPNLQITPAPSNAASLRIYIRGVGNFDDQLTQDPSVAVYTDGVYMARSQGLASEVADLERVEVLRGPQGSLYGRNATGGAINFITKAPRLGTWGFSQSITAGSDAELRSRTMLNAPLGDQAALRLSYARAKKDGFVDNRGSGEDTFGARDRDAMRADLRWQPADEWDMRYTYDRSHIEDTALYFTPDNLAGDAKRPSHAPSAVDDFEPSDITTQGHQLTLTWNVLDNLTLKSISAYRKLDNYNYQDYLTYIPGAPNASIIQDDLQQDQRSQELQLLGNALDQQLEYVGGLYYFHEEGDGRITSLTQASNFTQYRDFDIDNTAKAVFGQLTYSPAALDKRLHLTLGVRKSWDDRDADLAIINAPGGVAGAPSAGTGSRSLDNFSPSYTIAYDVSDTINVYAKYAKGYKSGGFNVRPSTIARFSDGFDPEKLDTYELGAKTEWWDNRVRLNAAVFHSNYDDIQINTQSDPNVPTASDILNAGEATIDGVELEVTAALTDELTIGLNYAYLNADYDKIENALGQDVTRNYIFVNAPQNSYVANIDYNFGATPAGDLSANINYSWQDDIYTTTATTSGLWTSDSYGLLNARLTLAEIPGIPAGKLRVALWGKNLEDKEYRVIHAPAFGGYSAFGDTRSAGVDLVYEY